MSKKETPYGMKGPRFKDLMGQRFDKLTVIEYAGYNDQYKNSKWKCRCDCGTEVIRQMDVLSRKRSQHSCGCAVVLVLPDNQHAFKRLMNCYKQNAKKRGYQFNLTVDEFKYLVKQPCYYCKAEPEVRYQNCTVDPILANGVDRRDNTIDYNFENCVPSCKVCNMAKGILTMPEFKAWIERVYNNKETF